MESIWPQKAQRPDSPDQTLPWEFFKASQSCHCQGCTIRVTRNQLLLQLWNQFSVLPPSVCLQLTTGVPESTSDFWEVLLHKPDTDPQPSGQSQMDTEPTKRKKVSKMLQIFLPSHHPWCYKLQAAITYFPLQESLCVKHLGRVLKM